MIGLDSSRELVAGVSALPIGVAIKEIKIDMTTTAIEVRFT